MAGIQRDSQRQKVYDSEYAFRDAGHSRKFKDITDAQKYIDRIERSSWFAKTFPTVKRHVKVTYKGGSRWANGGYGKISLPRAGWYWAGNDVVVLHELAHNLTPGVMELGMCTGMGDKKCGWHTEPGTHMVTGRPAAHGPEFTRIFLDLVRRFMGKDAYEALRGEYRKRRVKVGVRSKVYAAGQWAANKEGK